MKLLLPLMLLCCLPYHMQAQPSKTKINDDASITWLGLDFSNVNFVGPAAQWKDAGEVTDEQMRDKYFTGWNELFINEQKKYDVAKYTNRDEISFATDVTRKVNNKTRGNYFVEDPNLYQTLDKDAIAEAVKGYDLKGKSGIGLVFIVEGMSKGKAQSSAWVTFVDMSSKQVLHTERVTGKAGGIGFRNYWASSFLKILKEVPSTMR